MPKNDIGGFFVSLGLNIDKDSFETGNRLIDGVGNSFNKLIGSARNAAVVLAGTALATGAVESQAGKLAEEIGISTEALEQWKATAKIAGVDAGALVNKMAEISNVLQRMDIDGAGLEELAQHLGELGIVSNEKIDIEKLLKLSPDELVKEVLDISHRALTSGANKQDVQQIVKDIIGQEGEKLFIDLERRGITIGTALDEAAARTYTNNETNANAQEFMTEVRLLKQASENMTKLLGSEVADQLTEYVKDINEWIGDHGTEIANGIKTVADGVGKLVGHFVDFITDEDVQDAAKKAGEVLIDSITGTYEGTKDIIEGIKEGDGKKAAEGAKKAITSTVAPIVEGSNAIEKKLTDNESFKDKTSVINESQRLWNEKYGDHPFVNYLKKLTLNELPEDLQKSISKIRETDPKWLPNTVKLKDGIMRPDGTVTQVAPDDWVFAARNIGDMARAFIPQNHTAVSAGEYIINQTFNINGGNDMPQVLRQQAYRGTQDGLLELMNESSRRLQLMSGTR